MNTLKGKIAVITGSTRGLGLAIAKAFAEEGASVVITSRSNEAVNRVVDDMRSAGHQAAGMAVDVSDIHQVRTLADFVVKTFGRIDIWVNNAGITGAYGPTTGIDPEVFSGVVNTNILGTYHGSIFALNQFKKQGGGKLINMLGMGYKKPAPWQNAYGSSKAWIRNFTKALAKENKAFKNIGIHALNPGMVLTDLLVRNEVVAGSEDRLKVFPTIVRMWAKPGDVPARKAVWLASPATDGKTGLEANVFSFGVMLKGAVLEGWRLVTGGVPPKSDVDMTVVPGWEPDNK